MDSTTVDRLISHTRSMTKRSRLVQSINEDLCLQMDQLQLHVIQKEDTIEELHTRLENTNIFLRHLTSLELRCDFLEKQIAHLEGEDASAKDSEILATRNLGLHEFRMWKENNINRKTVETTLENLAREYDYLTEQLQQANQACATKEDEDEGRTNVSSVDDTYTETSNDASIFSTLNDSNASSSSIEITNAGCNNYNEQGSVGRWKKCQKPQKNEKKRHLLKMESFLTIPYEQKIVQNKPRDVEKPYLKHFKISSLQSGGSSRTKSGPRIVSTSTTVSEASFPPRSSGKWHLPILNVAAEDSETEENDKTLTEDYQSTVAEDTSSFIGSLCSCTPHYTHRRHLSMPGTNEMPELIFGDAEGNSKNAFTEVSTGNIQGYIHQPNGEEKADSQRLDFKWLLRKKRDQDNEFLGTSQGVLRHFVSQDTGLNLIHRGGKIGRSNIGDFMRPKISCDEDSYEQGYASDDSYGEEVARPLILESVEEESDPYYAEGNSHYVEGNSLYLEGDSEEDPHHLKKDTNHVNKKNPQYSDDQHNSAETPPIRFKDDTGIIIPCKAAATIRKSHSHESIFDDYQMEQEKHRLEMQSMDLKSQTLKWLKPCTPVISSTRETVRGRGEIMPKSRSAFCRSNEETSANMDCQKQAETSGDTKKCHMEADTRNIPQATKQIAPIAISLPNRGLGRKTGSTLTAECLTSASTKRSRWWQSMIPNSAIVVAETGTLINRRASRSLATNCSSSYKSNRFASSFLRPQAANMNGSFSTMVIGHNGSRMISHGFGSEFNSSVVSSEVNQDDLQDALEGDIGKNCFG